jgi:hypothetical protein
MSVFRAQNALLHGFAGLPVGFLALSGNDEARIKLKSDKGHG